MRNSSCHERTCVCHDRWLACNCRHVNGLRNSIAVKINTHSLSAPRPHLFWIRWSSLCRIFSKKSVTAPIMTAVSRKKRRRRLLLEVWCPDALDRFRDMACVCMLALVGYSWKARRALQPTDSFETCSCLRRLIDRHTATRSSKDTS